MQMKHHPVDVVPTDREPVRFSIERNCHNWQWTALNREGKAIASGFVRGDNIESLLLCFEGIRNELEEEPGG